MSLKDLMQRLIPPASYVLFLFFLTGIWLAISPFAMTTQPAGAHWIAWGHFDDRLIARHSELPDLRTA